MSHALFLIVALFVLPLLRAETEHPEPAAVAPAPASPAKPEESHPAAPPVIEAPAQAASAPEEKAGEAALPLVETVNRQAEEIASLMRIGEAKRTQGDWTSAELAFRQVMNASIAKPDQKRDALLGLARTYRGHSELTKACAVYERILKDYPGDAFLPVVYLELGRCLRVLGAYKLAISRFYSVINSTLKLPEDGATTYRQLARTAQFEVAETYFQSGDYEQAHRFYSRLNLLDLLPADRARAAFKSASALNLGGDYEKAVPHLRAYLSLYPEDENAPEARYLLSTILGRLNQKSESLAVAMELLRIEKNRTAADPKTWAYWQRKTGNQLANQFYEQGDAATALTIYQTLHELGGGPEWRLPALYQIGLCQERLRQTAAARSSYQSILDTLAAPAGDGAKPRALDDLASMAEWRLSHLDWQEKTDQRLAVFKKPESPPPPTAKP